MAHMDDLFGCNVFNDAVMQQRLPKDTYKALKKTIDEGRHLDPQVASGGRSCHEGLGSGKGRHALHPLVPAHDGYHR